MLVRRLGWSGVEIETHEMRLAIDLIESAGFLDQFMGEPREPLPPASGPVDLALLTHLHRDHADASALARAMAPGGLVLRPAPAEGGELEVVLVAPVEEELARAGLQARTVAPWETVRHGEVAVTALPASDGFGDPQVSWLVEAEGRRVLHAGDTHWHGNWWTFVLRHGPIDVAFLPINGVVVQSSHRQPSVDVAAAMNPEEAAAAARALQARLAVPIHHTTFEYPPYYQVTDDATGRFARESERLGVHARIVAPGEEVQLPG